MHEFHVALVLPYPVSDSDFDFDVGSEIWGNEKEGKAGDKEGVRGDNELFGHKRKFYKKVFSCLSNLGVRILI
jgi:hypothetical protein